MDRNLHHQIGLYTLRSTPPESKPEKKLTKTNQGRADCPVFRKGRIQVAWASLLLRFPPRVSSGWPWFLIFASSLDFLLSTSPASDRYAFPGLHTSLCKDDSTSLVSSGFPLRSVAFPFSPRFRVALPSSFGGKHGHTRSREQHGSPAYQTSDDVPRRSSFVLLSVALDGGHGGYPVSTHLHPLLYLYSGLILPSDEEVSGGFRRVRPAHWVGSEGV